MEEVVNYNCYLQDSSLKLIVSVPHCDIRLSVSVPFNDA